MTSQGFNFSAKFKQAAPFRPMLNVGALMDIQTGRYIRGAKGESILNGGVANIEGITGPGNSMKSTMANYRLLVVLLRYLIAMAFVYDTENSATRLRYQQLAKFLDPTGELSESLSEDIGRFGFTDAAEYDGTQWFSVLKETVAERLKEDTKIPTPFVDKLGNPINIYAPALGLIDSFSQFQSSAVRTKADKGDVGESDLNAIAMQNANAKAQVMDALPILTSKGGFYMAMTAHMGDTIVMDQYSQPKKKLAFVKNTRKMKKVPEGFTFLTNNLFEITDLKPLINQGTKQVEFPRSKEDDLKGNTDLMLATVLPIRTKSGITGIPFELIFSQTDGLQATLSEFWYCKTFDRYGLSSNPQNQFIDLYPDVKFTRNTIRELIKQDPLFCRAMQITADMCQMRNLWHDFSDEYLVSPAELYKGLKEKGYDWDVLLRTRTWWTFDQYTHPIPFLSTKDLLDMYHGTYKPYWM